MSVYIRNFRQNLDCRRHFRSRRHQAEDFGKLHQLSKLLERIVVRQLMAYLHHHQLLPPLQSGFRSGHSTETGGSGRRYSGPSGLVNSIRYGRSPDLIRTSSMNVWYRPQLVMVVRFVFVRRSQSVCCGLMSSTLANLVCGVPQGSILGPVLFIFYTADLSALIQRNGLAPDLKSTSSAVQPT